MYRLVDRRTEIHTLATLNNQYDVIHQTMAVRRVLSTRKIAHNHQTLATVDKYGYSGPRL